MVDYPHGIWVDSHGDIYMCEVPFTPSIWDVDNQLNCYRYPEEICAWFGRLCRTNRDAGGENCAGKFFHGISKPEEQ